MKNKVIQGLIFVIFLSLIFNSNIVTEELIYALNTFFTVLFPSIFPFFLIGNLLIEYNFVHTLNRIFSKITKTLFHTTPAASFVILMSMISGFPSGAKYIKDLFDKKNLSIEHANYLITFTHFANPIFVLTITKKIFNDINISIYILISMYLSNILIGIITRPKKESIQIKMELSKVPNFSDALSKSIKNSFDLLLMILGNTCFFFLITRLISTYININDYIDILIIGFFDITKGIQSISNLSSTLIFKVILVLTFICFGGINIHMQVKNIIGITKISYKNFLLGRICQIGLSILIFIILYQGMYLH